MTEDLIQQKVLKFEEFVDRRLKPDLVKAVAQRDKVFEQQTIFLDLRRNIETLQKNGVTSLRSMVNLGSEVYMQADVPDTQRIFVDIGLGFHVEFTWSEALNFIRVREAILARQIEEYTQLIARIKAQIKLPGLLEKAFRATRMRKYNLPHPNQIFVIISAIGFDIEPQFRFTESKLAPLLTTLDDEMIDELETSLTSQTK